MDLRSLLEMCGRSGQGGRMPYHHHHHHRLLGGLRRRRPMPGWT